MKRPRSRRPCLRPLRAFYLIAFGVAVYLVMGLMRYVLINHFYH